MRNILIVIALVAFGSVGYAYRSTAQSTGIVASPGIETLVRQALEDRLAAGDFPDRNLLGSARRIAIREEMPQARMKLGAGALPQQDGYEFYLISEKAAQVEADSGGHFVHFITVDEASIDEDTATVWLGVDFVFRHDPKLLKMCCCKGLGRFQRIDGRWTFVKWAIRVCS